MRVGAAVVLGHFFGFEGVVWSNPLAWFGACVILIPAYLRADRRLAKLPVDPIEVTATTAIPIVGPTDGSMVVDAVVTASVPVIGPLASPDGGRGDGARRRRRRRARRRGATRRTSSPRE